MGVIPDSKCPAEGRLIDYLNGQPILESQELAHIQICTTCQCTLDRLTESDFLVPYHTAAIENYRSLAYLEPPLRSSDIGAIGGLAIEDVVDNGGMGTVLRGIDLSLGRTVAIKVLMDQNSHSSYSRFEAEVHAVAKLSSPHIVPIYSVGRTLDHRPYMVMPFIAGENLATRLKQGPLSPRQSAEYVRQIASGLMIAHEAGLIHRDIKPANVLIDSTDGRAKIIDFGLVRDPSKQRLTHANVVCGTPEYMSYEQAQRPDSIDVRSDIYSLGITLYECLTGTTPFRGQPLEVLEQHRTVDPVPPTQLNRRVERDLETICLQAIAKDPARRYASMQDMASDLACYLSGDPIRARPLSTFERLFRWCTRNPSFALLIMLLLFSLTTGTVVSTSLWLISRRHAATAMESTQALKLSRDRLQDSVQLFQSRVFSDEALHWQMSREFRTDMFRDVIRYLDEFAAFSAGDQPRLQRILYSYLEVAQSAFQVGQYDQSAAAAQRALTLRQPNLNHDSVESLLGQSTAARLLYLSLHQQGTADTHTLESIGRQCFAALDAAEQLKPDDVTIIAHRLSDLLALWEAGYDPQPLDVHQLRIAGARQTLESQLTISDSREVQLVIRRSLAQCHFALLELQNDPAATELLNAFDANVTTLKDVLRGLQKPLLECNRMSGRFRLFLGEQYLKNADFDAAKATLQMASTEYQKAVSMQPQNRRWRLELAEVQSQLAECLIRKGEPVVARDALNLTILNLAQILETDPKDTVVRVTIVNALIRFGEICLLADDYKGAYRGFYTAAQDCRLLMLDDELLDWAFSTRLWALVRTEEALDKFDSAVERQRTNEHFASWLSALRKEDRYGSAMADQAAKTVEHRTLPERLTWPPQLKPLPR